MADATTFDSLACPAPLGGSDQVLMGHGSGGRMTADLVRRLFVPAFSNDILSALEDQATLPLPGCRLAFTTDSFVVRPLFFPGGDIGKLAVHGTVNDLAVGGAVPMYLAAAFILEEGLPMADLSRIVASMREACAEAGVSLVTGDTKVVDRGKGDGVFIATSGIGMVPHGRRLSIRNARPGDRVIVSGTLGDHGIAILSVREGIEFETRLESDTAPLHDLAQLMLEACPSIRCMRDPTRGGLSSSLNELAEASRVGVELSEAAIPLRHEVAGGVRDARPRSALCRQRGQARRRGAAPRRRTPAGGDAHASAGQGRGDDRRGGGGACGDGDDAHADRRRARGGAPGRGAVAEDLLESAGGRAGESGHPCSNCPG